MLASYNETYFAMLHVCAHAYLTNVVFMYAWCICMDMHASQLVGWGQSRQLTIYFYVIRNQCVLWTAWQESKGRRNDAPRTISMQLENGGFPSLGSPTKRYISRP